MGLSCGAVEIIIHEHLYRPLRGEILLIGRQNTDITPQAMTNLLHLYSLSPRQEYEIERPGSMDHVTRTLPSDIARITDVSVFHSLSDCNVKALDISDYEGAEILHDMNRPIPDSLKNRFDFIYDGSCLDNIFNGPQALINMSEMLRPGGRILLYNASNSAPTAYLQYSPDWFIDYFAVNQYADCKIYIHEFPIGAEPVIPDRIPHGGFPPQAGCLWHFDPFVMYSGGNKGYQNSQIEDGVQRYVYVIAEKAANSTSTLPPVQMHYRGNDIVRQPYLDSVQRFRASPRPLLQPRTGELFTAQSLSDWEIVYPISRWSRRSYPARPPSPHVNEAPVRLPEGKRITASIDSHKARHELLDKIERIEREHQQLAKDIDAMRLALARQY